MQRGGRWKSLHDRNELQQKDPIPCLASIGPVKEITGNITNDIILCSKRAITGQIIKEDINTNCTQALIEWTDEGYTWYMRQNLCGNLDLVFWISNLALTYSRFHLIMPTLVALRVKIPIILRSTYTITNSIKSLLETVITTGFKLVNNNLWPTIFISFEKLLI